MKQTFLNAIRWFVWNLSLPTVMLLIGVGFGAQYQLSEVDGWSYAEIVKFWPDLSPQTRDRIAMTFDAHGKIRHWDYYPAIFDSVLTDMKVITVTDFQGPYNVEAERVQLAQLVKGKN